ncbi:MAG: DNA-deoxyinosine glycosylase [Bacteroidales bacterium]|nr:DNA-deoxyinosine glycosylase [Bacteroidales bacterium]
MNEIICGFDAISGTMPRILILGTMPSVKSLEENQYYAHPRNAFWEILASFGGIAKPDLYAEKIILIQKMNLALWDVCATCIRQGSLDSAIREEVPNDIPTLLINNPSIQAIFFNGQPAEKLFRKHFPKQKSVAFLTLPSTSPANTLSLEKKCAIWHWALTDYL